MNYLILPGLNGSGPQHWQTIWEQKHPNFRRVNEPDWANPDRETWIKNLEEAVKLAGPDTILVAHSLACLQVVHWSARTKLKIHAAFLVAPPNPNRPGAPKEILGFVPVPRVHLGFKSLLVVSENDPYADLNYSQDCAATWGSELINIGKAGHINPDSGFGDWPQGLNYLKGL